jgi:hypothetical protein
MKIKSPLRGYGLLFCSLSCGGNGPFGKNSFGYFPMLDQVFLIQRLHFFFAFCLTAITASNHLVFFVGNWISPFLTAVKNSLIPVQPCAFAISFSGAVRLPWRALRVLSGRGAFGFILILLALTLPIRSRRISSRSFRL